MITNPIPTRLFQHAVLITAYWKALLAGGSHFGSAMHQMGLVS